MSRTRYSDILVYPTYYHVTKLVGLTDSDCISMMVPRRQQDLFISDTAAFKLVPPLVVVYFDIFNDVHLFALAFTLRINWETFSWSFLSFLRRRSDIAVYTPELLLLEYQVLLSTKCFHTGPSLGECKNKLWMKQPQAKHQIGWELWDSNRCHPSRLTSSTLAPSSEIGLNHSVPPHGCFTPLRWDLCSHVFDFCRLSTDMLPMQSFTD